MILLRFPQRTVEPESAAGADDGAATSAALGGPAWDGESPPANLRFLLTPDHDPSLDYLDQLSGLESLDDTEREARIADARHTGS